MFAATVMKPAPSFHPLQAATIASMCRAAMIRRPYVSHSRRHGCAHLRGARRAQQAPAATDPQNTLFLDTPHGRIVIKLRNDIAPKHAERLKQLAREKFYDNVPFHRVIEGFMAQTGDGTEGDGSGGSKYPNLPAEFSSVPFTRGIVGMARRGGDDNSANSPVLHHVRLHIRASTANTP